MCEKIKKGELRTTLRNMQIGEQISFVYSPSEMSLSSIRVTASTTGIDFGRRYKVSKKDDKVLIDRIQ